MSVTLSDLWGDVARHYGGLYVEGTATGGSVTTVIDANNLSAIASDYFNSAWVYIVATADNAAPSGEARLIADFANGAMSVTPAFTAVVESGDTYRAWAGPNKLMLLDAVKISLYAAYPAFYHAVQDETLCVAGNTYEYNIPATIEKLHEVWIDGDGTGKYYLPVENWRVGGGDAARTFCLAPYSAYTAGRKLRLVGTAKISRPATDTGALTLDAAFEQPLREYIGYAGAALCHKWMMLRDKDNSREHLTMAQELDRLAAQARRKGLPTPSARAVTVLPGYWR